MPELPDFEEIMKMAQNAQSELYLTDTVRDLACAGERVAVHMAPDAAEAEGVNTRAELAEFHQAHAEARQRRG